MDFKLPELKHKNNQFLILLLIGFSKLKLNKNLKITTFFYIFKEQKIICETKNFYFIKIVKPECWREIKKKLVFYKNQFQNKRNNKNWVSQDINSWEHQN